MPGTRKLGRPTAHRNAMLRGMVTLLLANGQVETTLTRAKEVRSMAEKMITLCNNFLLGDVCKCGTATCKSILLAKCNHFFSH